ncbi:MULTISPECIES: 4-alpha-glucanotransferase [Nocardiaceae]|uniref:4-alpha-glucanotransferase n=1 Tax=Rhodococcoides yunnanense TaxID=278209 RepID=A0ABU4BCW9_9NOCA|nr:MULTISPECIES: 4-alpha-glucanotransferase [Rhodococcus]MDI9895595.1 4-alpha-glucanotransferase [Rhodococcus sp. IEGM 1381]MDV6262052.1 4-alpha-glucanotransferase [Rhodococcus yunnanensis]
MDHSQALRTLARRLGTSTSYRGWDDTEHEVSDDTLQQVLTARGYATESPEDVDRALADIENAPWRRLLPPVVVATQGTDAVVWVHVPHGNPVEVSMVSEDGESIDVPQADVWVDPREIDGHLIGRATFVVPGSAPLGWHTLTATTISEDNTVRTSEAVVVVTPKSLSPNAELADRQRTGLLTQLYSVRSRRSWGIGDLADLEDMADIAGREHGFDYLLVNPLHADRPTTPVEASPYLPTTRRFFNSLYIRVENIRETAQLSPKQFGKVRDAARRFDKANTRTKKLDRDRTFTAKLRALERVHKVERSTARESAYRAFVEREGTGLRDFAVWSALAEKFGPQDQVWTDRAAHPRTDFVREQREKLADRIDFHMWLQWICDEQLAAAQRGALDAGMDIGIMHDLAVGVARGGADAWALGDVLASGVTVGAPPDNFNQQGQNWNQPPWDPDRLREMAYIPYRDMLRTILRHAGGIRVDHILGLFRLWWIPQEAENAGGGTYVEYDHEALIGILALEAERAGAVVVGEDLGVFEPMVQEYLTERGIFGTSILWFEADESGPIAPEEYRSLCLTSVNTHDLPPTAGYLRGEHIDLRSRLGLLERDIDAEKEVDARKREAVLDLARERGLLDTDTAADDHRTVEALHRLVQRSPSLLIGVALVDAVGEHRIQNQPGTDETQYENWKVPLADADGRRVLVEDLVDHPRMVSLAAAMATESTDR